MSGLESRPSITDRVDDSLESDPAMEHVSHGHTTAATIFVLAVLFPFPAVQHPSPKVVACSFEEPPPLEQLLVWSDAIVVGVPRASEPSLFDHKTIDVELWIVPAHPKSKRVQISGFNTYRAPFGKRVLLLLSEHRYRGRTADYTAMKVIDLEDSSDVAKALDEMNSPWIPHVTSTTSYSLTAWGDWRSHLRTAPMRNPLFLEVERILEAAWSKIEGR